MKTVCVILWAMLMIVSVYSQMQYRRLGDTIDNEGWLKLGFWTALGSIIVVVIEVFV